MKKYYTLIILLFLFAGPLASKTNAASFDFNPNNKAISHNCDEDIEVRINTQGEYSNAADLEIRYDPNKVAIIDSFPAYPGVQVALGDAYKSYVYNEVDTTQGIIRVAAGSVFTKFNGDKTFIKIKFKSINNSPSVDFTINFTGVGNTLDSNIAQTNTSLDLLTSVTNGHYTFQNTLCNKDITPPVILIIKPEELIVNGKLEFELEFTDDWSGVDIDSFVIIINGISYNPSSLIFNYTGNKSKYIVSLDPNIFIENASPINITFMVNDLAGNVGIKTITINGINLPETGACTDNVDIQNLINMHTRKLEVFSPFNINSIDEFMLKLGNLNNIFPGLGLLSLISLVLMGQSLFSLIYLFFILYKRRKIILKYWGIVFNSEKGIPLFGTKISLLNIDHQEVAKTETDLYGRYFFEKDFGKYYIIIKDKNFKIITEQITILEDEKIYVHNLEYKDNTSKLKWHRDRINYVFIRDFLVFSVLGFVLAMLGVIMMTNIFTVMVFILNIIILVISIIMKVYTAIEYGD